MIEIFDSENNKVFFCDSNFKKFCDNNNLPYKQLVKSYKNNGEKIITYKMSYGRISPEYRKYKNWYAVKKGKEKNELF